MKIDYNGTIIEASAGARLSDLIGGDAPCGGRGKCGKCRVLVDGALTPPTETERRLLGDDIDRGVRLACCCFVLGDVRVRSEDLSEGRIVTEGVQRVYRVSPRHRGIGAAVDLGTTTLAARIFDSDGRLLAEGSAMNPQISFGADVVSRIGHSMEGRGGELADSVRKGISSLICELSAMAGISSFDISECVITANTAMLHLLCALDCEPLAHAPFGVTSSFDCIMTAEEVGLDCLNSNTGVYFPPCISSFVGADTTCAILACSAEEKEKCLLCDVGTNGEMTFTVDGRLYVCSAAAGPAFEGVGIAHGMRGGVGAIDRVSVADGGISAHVIGEGEARGICGSGLVDAVAALLRLELVDEGGYMEDEEIIKDSVTITPADLRSVQLAKSAIFAALSTLVKRAGAELSDVSVFYVAGGFGKYLDMDNADYIGLFPKGIADKGIAVGNAALDGASMLLLDPSFRDKAASLARGAKTVELATDPYFMDCYVDGMYFQT